jgi:predicted small lipoprotein YifL
MLILTLQRKSLSNVQYFTAVTAMILMACGIKQPLYIFKPAAVRAPQIFFIDLIDENLFTSPHKCL